MHFSTRGLQRLATQAFLLPADLQPQVLWRADDITLGFHTDDGGDIHAYDITGESRQRLGWMADGYIVAEQATLRGMPPSH